MMVWVAHRRRFPQRHPRRRVVHARTGDRQDTIGERGWGFGLSAQSCRVLPMTLVLLRVRLRRPLLLGMLGCSLLAARYSASA
jgi:hypothetical protein